MPSIRPIFTCLAAPFLVAAALGCSPRANPPPAGPASSTNPAALDTETGSGSLSAPPPEAAKQ